VFTPIVMGLLYDRYLMRHTADDREFLLVENKMNTTVNFKGVKDSEFIWMCLTICIVCDTLIKLDSFGYVTLMFSCWTILEGFQRGRRGNGSDPSCFPIYSVKHEGNDLELSKKSHPSTF
jgi:hypothetical protein